MPVRLARHSDIPQLAEILAAGFGPDRLFQVTFPYQDEHPEYFIRALRQKLTESWWDYRKVIVCSYQEVDAVVNNSIVGNADDEDRSDGQRFREHSSLLVRKERKEIMTGVSEWERAGDGWEKVWKCWGGRWDPRNLITKLVAIYNSFSRLVYPDLAAARPTIQDPDPLTYYNFFTQMNPFVAQHFQAPWRQRHWSLELLAVHPAYQGQGFGKELVTWGLENLAHEAAERLPSVVIAANGKDGFYRHCGFDLLVGWATEGVGNPLKERGVGGGAVMWTKVKEDDEEELENAAAN